MGQVVLTRMPAMDRLKAKAAYIELGDMVLLDSPSDEFPDAPEAGLHTVVEMDVTFIKVAGNAAWVPLERVTGVLRRV